MSASYIYVNTLKLPVAIDMQPLPAPLFVPAGPAKNPEFGVGVRVRGSRAQARRMSPW